MRIGLSNISGKMGLAFQQEISKKPDMILEIGFSRSAREDNRIRTSSVASDLFKNTDVIIDFSVPTITEQIVNEAIEIRKPIVIGTTGLDQNHEDSITKASKNSPILCDQNTSLGITMLNAILPRLVENLKDFDIDVCDKHHKYKVDSPSGTAKKLIKTISDSNSDLSHDLYSAMDSGPRPNNKIGINVSRSGNIFGHHEISFTSESESITLSHTAFSRNLFASGALKAAKWLVNQKPGLYSMKDVFDL